MNKTDTNPYKELLKMMNRKYKLLLFLALPILAVSQTKENETFRLFFLGGQSNMEGHGLNTELPDSLLAENENIWIFNGQPKADEDVTGGLGSWSVLYPGNGAGFTSDGVVNNRSHKFGPELSFGQKIQQLYPNNKIALIKYARGGSSIDSCAAREYGSWEIDYKGINQFDHFLKTVKSALEIEDIDGNGTADNLIPSGIIWMQGESDACITEEIAMNYYDNLKKLMNLLRATFRKADIPVVIGKISDSGLDNNGKTWRYGELIQHAQEKYVETDRISSIVRTTKDYNYSDPWHYDSDGYINLGIRFAEEIYRLNQTNNNND